MLTASALAAGCSQSGGAASTTTSSPAPSTTSTSTASEPGAEWEHVEAADVGLDPAVLEAVVADAEAAGSSCVAVVRDGRMVVDEAWPEPEAPRQVFSVTKSLTSVLVGIAEHQGLLSVDDPVSDYVPEWVGTGSEEVTIEHVLTGVSGRQWDMATDYLQMASRAEDKTAFAIGLEQVHPPGEVWTYNNAAVQVLSRVLEEATGVDAATFAERELFEPLGMVDSHLGRDESGGPMTFMGLVSTCADVARLGQLMLQGGRWGDEQILSSDYVVAATSPATDLNAAYGRLWWVNGAGPISGPRLATTGRPEPGAETPEGPLVASAPPDAYWALGLDDQVLAVAPGEDLIAVRLGAKPPAEQPFGVEELTGGVLDAVVEPSVPERAYGPGWLAVHSDSGNTDYASVTGPSQVELAWDRRLEGDVQIGALEWTINLGPTSDPGGQLYLTSNVPRCHLQAIDVATGETVWCARESLQRLAAGGEQRVGVPTLRHTPAGGIGSVQAVALDDGDPAEPPRQHRRGRQPGHARADHHRMITSSFSVHATSPRAK